MPETKTPIVGQLLLLSTTAADAAPYLLAARKLGASCVLAVEAGPGLSGSGAEATPRPGTVVRDNLLRLRFDQREAALEIVQYAMEHPLAAIVAVDERTAPAAARAASMTGLPGHPPKAADACLDKFALRQKLGNAGVPVSLLGGSSAGDAPKAGPSLGRKTHQLRMTTSEDRSADCEIVAIVDDGKMRVLGVTGAPASEAPRAVLEMVWRAARVVMLKHGPLWARVSISARPTLLDLSPAIPAPLLEALRFKIPLVEEDMSLAEVILRQALGRDISRAHPIGGR